MENIQRFCKYCGSQVSGNFCPNCGAAIDGVTEPITPEVPKYENQPDYAQYQPKNEHNGMRVGLSVLLLLTGALFLSCAYFFVTATNELMQSADFADIIKALKDAGLDNVQIKDIITILGYVSFVPGILAVLASICGLCKKGYTFGLIVCIILTIFSIPTIIGLIIGIIVSYLWTKTEPGYANN